jgi:phosphoglycolate phosphatase
MTKCPRRVVLTDVDNTLFDWIAMWESGFRLLLREAADLSGLDEPSVKQSIRRANQLLGTSEYDDVALLLDIFDGGVRERQRERLCSIGHRIRASKEAATRLYPKVAKAISILRSKGIDVYCLTESVRQYAEKRASELGLDGLVDGVICSEFRGDVGARVQRYLHQTPVFTFSPGLRKPDPGLLRFVSELLGLPMARLIYVGDSLFKDVVMANSSRVEVCWARYGDAAASKYYSTLQEVSHWPDADINRERNVADGAVAGSHVGSRFPRGGRHPEQLKVLPSAALAGRVVERAG